MKRITISIVFYGLFLLVSLPVSAAESESNTEQRTSLLTLKDEGIEGYGGPHFRGTWINGGFGVFGGGPLQFVFDRSWSIGASFSYLEADVNGLMVGYGGIRGEYIFFPEKLVHFSLGAHIGAGTANYKPQGSTQILTSGLVVIEPEAMLLLNITNDMRLGLVGGYRYANLLEGISGISDMDLSGLFFGIALQEGSFFPSETLFQTKGSRIGTAGYYSVKHTWINGQPSVMDGGGTFLVIDRRYYIGINGYQSRGDAEINGNEFRMAQVGIFFEYFFFPRSIMGLSVGGPVSFGIAGYQEKQSGGMVGSGCLLVEPEVALTVNIAEFIQFRLGAGYRLAIGFTGVPGLSDINSFIGNVGIRFGDFSF